MQKDQKRSLKKNFIKGLASPFAAATLLWRRLFPFGIIPKDAEAYRIGSWSYGKLKRVPLTDVFPGIQNVTIEMVQVWDRDMTTSVDVLETAVLCSIVRHTNRKNILEIGTFNGHTSLHFALNSDALITTVDLPEDWKGTFEINVPGLYENASEESIIGTLFKKFPRYDSRIVQVRGDSAKLDWSKLNVPFDFAFIDGNHHYDYVMSDTKNVLKNISADGIIVWHDYGMIEDVSRAVDEFSKKINCFAIRGTRIAIGLLKKF